MANFSLKIRNLINWHNKVLKYNENLLSYLFIYEAKQSGNKKALK